MAEPGIYHGKFPLLRWLSRVIELSGSWTSTNLPVTRGFTGTFMLGVLTQSNRLDWVA
jgi:hypothetical protein